ncbi:universal stress protein [Desulfovibrio mangrovi]|uniref:universal stress protein n=1 Tax=Desulfovibrio mangrovi TaxID=2976983 RepID=UPI0022459E0D|nr:universal stress protein [Desulfovibrio mangrovi]UZP66407.1 universal stress protein [Desulfovibrio mangrovi]
MSEEAPKFPKGFNRILVPVDGSKYSLLAKVKAMSMGAAMGSEIVLLHVTGSIPNLIGGHAREELIEELLREGKDLLKPYVGALLDKGVKHRELVVVGDPGNVICDVAEREECDLIIMGSRGLSDLEGMVLGSVTHRVLNLSKLPVLVAR